MSNNSVTVKLNQRQDYQFDIHFDEHMPVLISDEPSPLGNGQGPSPSQLLGAAVGNCLSDSLLFAMRKFKQAPEPLSCSVDAQVGRNPQGHVRVLRLSAALRLGVAAAQLQHRDAILGQFEAFCTVTQSVGQGIPVDVQVFDALGVRLKP